MKRLLQTFSTICLGMLVLSGEVFAVSTSVFNERWLDVVVSIETIDEEGKAISVGTGFLMLIGQKHIVLVTAGHVIKDERGRMLENLQYRRADSEQLPTITNRKLQEVGAGPWFFDEKQDLACRFLMWKPDDKGPVGIPVESILKSEDLGAGAPLLVLGFPTGLRSTSHSYPIARSGIVARTGRKGFVVEAFVFPGNSGGPIIYVPPLKVGTGIKTALINEEKLVGMVLRYIPYQEVAISPQTKRPRVLFEENSGLCEVVPAEGISALLSRQDVLKQDEELSALRPQEKTSE